MLKNTKGFAVAESLLIVVIISILGGASYYVFNSKRSTENGYKIPSIKSPEKFKAFNIVAVGDVACDDNDYKKLDLSKSCKEKETADLAKSLNPDAILALGDLQYDNGALDKFNSHYDKSWGQLKNITYPTPGNHEYATEGASGYYQYFADSPYNQKIKQGYYSFDAGGWHIISLNSTCDKTNDCGPDSAQIKWLEADLAQNDTKCTLAYWHYPRFTSGKYFGDAKIKEYTQQFWEKLSVSKADIVLNGHDHIYEHFVPQNTGGENDKNGIREFLAGTGGRSLYDRKVTQDNTQFFDNQNFGVLNLSLNLSSYKWQFVNLEHNVLDSGSANCN